MLVVHVTNIPTPYRVAISNSISNLLSARGDDYILLFQAQGSGRRKWRNVLDSANFRCQFVRAWRIPTVNEKSWLLPFGLWSALRRLKPDVIVVAGMGFDALTCMLYSKVHQAPLAVHTGAIQPLSEKLFREESRLGQWLRLSMRRKIFFPNIAAWIAYGTKAKEYLENWKVPSRKIFVSRNTVEVAPFLALPRDHRTATCKAPFQVLYAGSLNKRKGFDLLMEVARQVKERVLFHVAGGDLTSLPRPWRRLRIPENLIFHGYVQYENLPSYYHLVDCFLLLSRSEVFGLVLVEAAAAGLPVIASQFAGGAQDVVKPEVNGFIVDPRRVGEIAALIDHLAARPDLVQCFGQASRRIVQESFLVRQSACAWVEAVEFACRRYGTGVVKSI